MLPIRPTVAFALAALAFGAPIAVEAADLSTEPLFELGLIGGGGYVPDYPAAGEGRVKGLALPYVVYRGEFLRAGDKGLVRGRLLRTANLEFDVSLSGSFSADSDDNDARRGMPDLDWMGEIGPRLQITLARPTRRTKFDLELPLRAAFSTDFGSTIDYRGLIFAPQLAYQSDNFLGAAAKLKLSVGPIFASERLMDYFYGVPARFATTKRPRFSADAGYLGTKLQLLMTERISGRLRSFLGLSGDFHHGAANSSSPLFRDKITKAAGLGLIWSFYQSRRRGRE